MKNMKNKRICWITAPYMLQVDLPILSTLSKNYGIDWFVWGSSVSDNAGLAKTYAEKNDIPLRFIESPYSFYNPMSLIFCCKILRTLKMNGYDAYYLDIPTLTYQRGSYRPIDKPFNREDIIGYVMPGSKISRTVYVFGDEYWKIFS